jgi:hypothetical protein
VATRFDRQTWVRHPIRNAWYLSRIPLARSTSVARALSFRQMGANGGRLTRRTAACIDGFQRSGNTVAVYAFWRSNPEIRLAHHLHAAGEVERAVRRSVPTVVLIREPAAAISSLIVYQAGDMAPRLGIESYIAFYRQLLPYSGRFAVCTFEQLMEDHTLPIALLNEHFGTDFLRLPLSATARDELRTAIAHTQRRRGDPRRKWSVPLADRDALRAAVIDALHQAPRFADATQLHEAFIELTRSG